MEGDFGEGTVRLFDAGTGELVREFGGCAKERRIDDVAFSPDGKAVAASGGDMPMHVWETKTGKRLHDLGSNCDGSVSFSPDGRTLASGGLYGRVRFWDLASGKETPLPEGDDWRIDSLAYSPDGRTLATYTGVFRLWDARTGRPLHRWSKRQDDEADAFFTCPSVRFLPAGRGIIGTVGRKTPVLCDAATGRELRRLPPAKGSICAFALSADGRFLAANAFEDGKHMIRIWDIEGDREKRIIPLPADVHGSIITPDQIAFAPDGKTLAVAYGQAITLMNVETGDMLRQFKQSQHGAAAIAISPDGAAIASCEGAELGRVW